MRPTQSASCVHTSDKYFLWRIHVTRFLHLQTQLTQKGLQLVQQAEAIAALTTEREQLDATAHRQSTILRSVQEELKSKAAQIQDLVTQLANQHQELQSSQQLLQQQKAVHSELESQLGNRTAELSVVSDRASSLQADKQNLQQKLDAAVSDQQQLQSSLKDQEAAAEKLSRVWKTKHEQLEVLQLTHAH